MALPEGCSRCGIFLRVDSPAGCMLKFKVVSGFDFCWSACRSTLGGNFLGPFEGGREWVHLEGRTHHLGHLTGSPGPTSHGTRTGVDKMLRLGRDKIFFHKVLLDEFFHRNLNKKPFKKSSS